MDELVNAEHHKSVQGHIQTEDIEYGYCTEFMVKLDEEKQLFSEETFRLDLSEHGDSFLVIADETLVKVHIHAEHPGEVLNYAQTYGSLVNMKIENMREQHSNIIGGMETGSQVPSVATNEKLKEYGIVTVSMGKGIAKVFKSIGAHAIIEGGQTMNPSTEDIVQAIKNVNAKKVIVLPNNKNIIMAAEQAAEMTEAEVVVVPSKTVPQGLTALLAFNPGASLQDNKNAMSEALKNVKTGQITFAVRDTNIDGLTIEKDDFMGIFDGKIVVKNKDKIMAAEELLRQMMDEDSEILTILKGEDASDDDVQALTEFVESNFQRCRN